MADSGIVKSVSGAVKAIAIDGTERILQIGDRVFLNEQIVTGDTGTILMEFSNGTRMDLGRNASETLNDNSLNLDTGTKQVGQTLEEAQDEVEAFQKAFLEGEVIDPSELEATAAGGAPPAASGTGTGGDDGHTTVSIDYLNPKQTPGSGFETKGISVSFPDLLEELLLSPDVNDTPTAATTTVLLDEDDIAPGQEAANYEVLRTAFENGTGLDVGSFFVIGVNDEAEGDDLPINSPTTFSGKLVASFGNDGPGNIVFNPEGTQPAGITSGGEPVQYWVSADGHSLVAYILTDQTINNVNESIEVAQIIFTAEITNVNAGTFRVALYGPVDHPDGATEDNLLINLGFTISDFDGETAAGVLGLNVDDDSPVIGDIETRFVDEEGLQPEGNEGDSYDGGDIPDAIIEQDRSLNISWGADDNNDEGSAADRSVAFDNQSAPVGLTSNGLSVSYHISVDGQTLTAYTGEFPVTGPIITQDGPVSDYNEIFVVTLSGVDQGRYHFELKDNLDHDIADTEDDIPLTFAFTATDSDGDAASSSFTVTVNDDGPVIGDIETRFVDEEGLQSEGNEGDSYDDGGDIPGAIIEQDRSLNISWGADDNNDEGSAADRSVAFDNQSVPVGLTSNGLSVSYHISVDGQTLTAYTGEFPVTGPIITQDGPVSDYNEVFVVTLSDVDQGRYHFELKDNLDHDIVDTEDDIPLTFAFTATDSDADTASSSFTVTVDDDGLVISEEGGAIVIHDESAGAQPTAADADIAHDLFTFLLPENAGLPIELMGLAVNPISSAISYNAGADGLANVALTDVNGNGFSGALSGLTTAQDDQPIYLYSVTVELLTIIANAFGTPLGEVGNLADNMVIGLTLAGADLTNLGDSYGSFEEFISDIAFVVGVVEGDTDNSVDDQLAVFQLQAIHHDNSLDQDDEVSINKVIHLTVTDGDGDTATTSEALTITFDDDGPVISEEGSAIVIHDESEGAQPTADDVDIAHDLFTFLIPEANPFIELIGLAVNPISNAISYKAGTDGLANVALTDVNGNGFSGTPSGLTTTQDDKPIYLYSVTVELLTIIANAYGTPLGEVANLADNMVLGLTSAGVDLTNPGSSYGSFEEFISDIVFVVGIVEGDTDNSVDDQLAVLQLKAIHHDNPLDHDDEVSINKVIHLTITDGDGDAATTSEALTITFDDDGPLAQDFQVDVTEATSPGGIDFSDHVKVGADLAGYEIRIIKGPDNGTLPYANGELSYNTDFQMISLGQRDGAATLADWGITSQWPVWARGILTMDGITATTQFIDFDNMFNLSNALKIYHNSDAPPSSQHIGQGGLADVKGGGINPGEVIIVTFDKLMQYVEIGVDGLGNDFLPVFPTHDAYAHATWAVYRGNVEVAGGEIDNPEGQREGFDGLQEIFTVSISEGFDGIVFGNNSQYDYSNYEVRFIEAEAKVVDSFEYKVVDGDGDSVVATVDIEAAPGGVATQQIDYFIADEHQVMDDVFRFTKDSIDTTRVEGDIIENFDVDQDVLDLADLLSDGSYTVDGISVGSSGADEHLQLQISTNPVSPGISELVQTIDFNGVLTGGNPVDTLNAMLANGSIEDGII